MALKPDTNFAGKINPATSAYPYGSARNVTTQDDGTGTPFIDLLINDNFGWQQALLDEAGIVPSGSPDSKTTSQYLDAWKSIFYENSKIADIEALAGRAVFATIADAIAGDSLDGVISASTLAYMAAQYEAGNKIPISTVVHNTTSNAGGWNKEGFVVTKVYADTNSIDYATGGSDYGYAYEMANGNYVVVLEASSGVSLTSIGFSNNITVDGWIELLSDRYNKVVIDCEVLLTSVSETVTFKELDSNLVYTNTNIEAQVYLNNKQDFTLEFEENGKISTTKTDGGCCIVINNFKNIKIVNPKISGLTDIDSGGNVLVTGCSGILLLSTVSPSENLTLESPNFSNLYSHIDVAGDPSDNAVTNVFITGNINLNYGYYGLSCRGNGRVVHSEIMHTKGMNRPFFIYDTSDINISVIGEDMNGGFQSLIKAYNYNTSLINVTFTVKNRQNIQACLGVQSQHNTANQATPAYVRDLQIQYMDIDSIVGGKSILFDYIVNGVVQPTTSSQIFDNIRIGGKAAGDVSTTVAITSFANYCVLQTADLDSFDKYSIYNGKGFIPNRKGTFTLTDGSAASLSINASSGIFAVGDYGVTGSISVTYPTTADSNQAILSGLPCKPSVELQSCQGCVVAYTDVGFVVSLTLIADSNLIFLYKLDGTSLTNADLSGKTIRFSFSYLL